MKVEVGTFSADDNSVVILLEDQTMITKAVTFTVGANKSNVGVKSDGFTDGVRNRCSQTLITATKRESKRSVVYSVIYYEDVNGVTTVKIKGRAADTGLCPAAGQIALHFDYFDPSIPIDFLAIGE